MMVKSKVKYIQSLSQKKQRDDDGVFVAEGPKIINELLGSDLVELLELFALEEWTNSNSRITAIHLSKIEVIDEQMLSRLSFLSTPNLVIGIFKKRLAENFNMK
ncbi:MAG: hypothetical protein ABI415_10315, partial [Flavitalea sp.]